MGYGIWDRIRRIFACSSCIPWYISKICLAEAMEASNISLLNVHADKATLLRVGAGVRLFVLFLGIILDQCSTQWKYTDIDYTIYSDAANLIWSGHSPYERPTYRYPPLYAWLMMINTKELPWLGKIWFVFFDILVVTEIWKINILCGKMGQNVKESRLWWLFWAVNPISTYLATRGSMDSVSNYLILLTLRLLLQMRFSSTSSESQPNWLQHRRISVLAGISFGAAVYCRIYPIIYLPAFLTFIYSRHGGDWVIFLHTFLAAIAAMMLVSYSLYGADYLDQSILYHFTRSDHRHNFSPYFYHYYLTHRSESINRYSPILLRILAIIVQWIGVLLSTWRFASSDLPFCLFIMTLCFVSFNKVITGQYFLWFLIFVPICWDWKGFGELLSSSTSKLVLLFWLTSLLAWLLFAFKLEIEGINTFILIWISSIVFLLANTVLIAFLLNSRFQRRRV
jgi:phosphatidylinositol glycan class M